MVNVVQAVWPSTTNPERRFTRTCWTQPTGLIGWRLLVQRE